MAKYFVRRCQSFTCKIYGSTVHTQPLSAYSLATKYTDTQYALTSIGHTEVARREVLELEVFIFEPLAIDTLSSCPISLREVPTCVRGRGREEGRVNTNILIKLPWGVSKMTNRIIIPFPNEAIGN